MKNPMYLSSRLLNLRSYDVTEVIVYSTFADFFIYSKMNKTLLAYQNNYNSVS